MNPVPSSAVPRFTVRVDQNMYLAVGARIVDAIVQVSAVGSEPEPEPEPVPVPVPVPVPEPDRGGPGAGPVAAQIVIIDVSGSMAGSRLMQARKAAAAAVDALREGTYFAVVAGESFARGVYPADVALARASGATRAAAKTALRDVRAGGGTTMSTWLDYAGTVLADCPATIRHVILLTDGQNMESAADLRAALAAHSGRFVCDCRGVGENWSPSELREIAHAFLGSWAPVAEPEHLVEDFRAMVRESMAKAIESVFLRISLPGAGKVIYLARVMPTVEEMTDRGVRRSDHDVEFPIGSWGIETRDYHLRIEARQRDLKVEDDIRARVAWVDVVRHPPGGEAEVLARRCSVEVVWTGEVSLSAPVDGRVAGYTGQEDLARTVREGLAAWRRGTDLAAERKLGLAVALARQLGRTDVLEKLSDLVIPVDLDEGVVRLRERANVDPKAPIWAEYLSEQSA
jgi:von Willebrand factor type A domain